MPTVSEQKIFCFWGFLCCGFRGVFARRFFSSLVSEQACATLLQRVPSANYFLCSTAPCCAFFLFGGRSSARRCAPASARPDHSTPCDRVSCCVAYRDQSSSLLHTRHQNFLVGVFRVGVCGIFERRCSDKVLSQRASQHCCAMSCDQLFCLACPQRHHAPIFSGFFVLET
jgi:hypothetical protein